jgi:hypothetical protein
LDCCIETPPKDIPGRRGIFGTDLDGQIALELARTPHQKQFGGNQLLKLCVFGFGLVENRDVWVSVFPEGKEVFIGRLSPVSVSDKNVGARKLQMRQRANGVTEHDAAMIKDFLKFDSGVPTLACRKIGLAAHISRVESARANEYFRASRTYSALIRDRGLKQINGLSRCVVVQSEQGKKSWRISEVDLRIFREAD